MTITRSPDFLRRPHGFVKIGYYQIETHHQLTSPATTYCCQECGHYWSVHHSAIVVYFDDHQARRICYTCLRNQ